MVIGQIKQYNKKKLGTEGAYASVKCYAYMLVCKYAELKYTSCNESLLLLVEHYVSD